MFQSHVIEVGGEFAGTAIRHDLAPGVWAQGARFRFKAIDPRVEELDDSVWGTLADVRRVVTHLFRTGRLPG